VPVGTASDVVVVEETKLEQVPTRAAVLPDAKPKELIDGFEADVIQHVEPVQVKAEHFDRAKARKSEVLAKDNASKTVPAHFASQSDKELDAGPPRSDPALASYLCKVSFAALDAIEKRTYPGNTQKLRPLFVWSVPPV
jgi:hypothetical protein